MLFEYKRLQIASPMFLWKWLLIHESIHYSKALLLLVILNKKDVCYLNTKDYK